MSIDYSQITFRTFEILAQKYLERKYPDFKWHITPSSGDGNKDILCKYKVLDQEHQYWAEAKFTRSRSPHKLSKGQLDPTLVSALLSSIPVSLCFISNSQITESYYYRLKDFKLKTNIGVELVLKDEFENWLLNNPDILKDYNIKVISHDEIQDLPQFQIHSAIITDILNVNQYKTENYLLEKTIYYLYIIISSKSEIAHASLKCSSGITLLQRSGILENPNDFKIEQGKRVYKFELLPHIVGTRNMTLKLIIGEKEVSVYTINDLVIKSNSNITLSYVQQEKSLHEISRYIRESCEHNFLIPIVGSGATGKTKLIQDLYCELNSIENVLSVSFIGNEYLDARTLLKILLFFNIGNVFDYEQNDIRSQLELLSDEKQKIFYKKLLDGWFISPESCVKELIEKILSYDICLLYPSHSRVKQIVLLDDVHKGKSILSKILGEFVKQFMVENNNQVIVFACREYYEDFMIDMSLLQKDWIKMYYLKGLTKEDKQTTISQYFSYDNDIHFHSATDDLIVFSNILQSKLSDDESKKMESDSISKNVDLVRAFENPKIVNNFQYREKLNHLRKYNNILEIVYLMNFGIDYAKFIGIFSYNDIEYLLEKKVIKRVGKKILPYHDYYVQAFWERHKISDITVEIVKKLLPSAKDYGEKYLYLSQLLKCDYYVYCQIEKEAHELEYHYFKITDYYKAYVLAKAFEKHMNFNEQLSLEELYDLLILAISSGYFEKPECVKMRYSQLVRLGKSMISISEAQGIVLRAQSEIINIDYWELNIPGLAEKIDTIIKQIPPLHPCDNEDLICAYLNLLNRQMVVALLVDDFEKAERIYQKNLTEIKRLNKQEYVGYLYMDYAKGLYNHNPTLALQYMKQAQIIFQKLGTECRRLLDCSCEVEYLKCITSDENNFTKLESAAQELLQAQYQEIYSKAKLKIAALKLVRNTPLYSEMDIQQDLYLSEYILTYPATGRLRLLQIMVKNAFLIYTHQTNKIIEYTIEDKKIIAKLGNCYNQIWSSNEIGTKRSVQFWNRNTELNVYYLDARIW